MGVEEILTYCNIMRSTHCRKFLLETAQTRLLHYTFQLLVVVENIYIKPLPIGNKKLFILAN